MNFTLKPIRSLGILCLLIPFLLCAYILYDGVKKQIGTEYRFAIEGFDPRDILRGHYMTFRYKWPEPQPKCPIGDCSLCVSGDPLKPTISIHNQNNACEVIWDMRYSPTKVLSVPQPHLIQSQFYIPELEAPFLEKMLQDNPKQFSVGVVIRNGSASVKNLYIDNIPLKKYLKQ